MSEKITVQGLVATTPRHIISQHGLPITSFRVASTDSRFDQVQGRWVDGNTNWFSVTSFKQLAINVAGSINKGDRVIITGELRIRDWDNGQNSGTSVEIEAESIGHDLVWGSSTFNRTVFVRETPDFPVTATPEPQAEPEPEAEPQRDADGYMTDGAPHSCSCDRCDQ